MRQKLAFLLCGSCLILASGCGGNNAIQVGNTQISMDSFNRWVQTNAGMITGSKSIALDAPDFKACVAAKKKAAGKTQIPSDPALRQLCSSLYKAAQAQTLKTLVSQAWVVAQAKKQGLKVDNKQVDTLAATLRQQFHSSPLNAGDLKAQAQYTLLLQQLRQKAEKIPSKKPSDDQLKRYYASHLQQFSRLPSRDIMMLIAKNSQTAQAAKQAVRSGKSWDSAFRSYNDNSIWGANNPLQVGATKPGFQPQLQQILFSAPIGVLSGPTRLTAYGNGWIVYKVLKVNPGYPAPDFQKVKSQVAQNFLFAEQSKAADQALNKLQKIWQPRTQCADSLQKLYPCKGTTNNNHV